MPYSTYSMSFHLIICCRKQWCTDHIASPNKRNEIWKLFDLFSKLVSWSATFHQEQAVTTMVSRRGLMAKMELSPQNKSFMSSPFTFSLEPLSARTATSTQPVTTALRLFDSASTQSSSSCPKNEQRKRPFERLFCIAFPTQNPLQE